MYFKNDRDEKRYNDNYRMIEAMYRKGMSIDDICNDMKSRLSRIDTIDIIQKIFAMDEIRKEKRRQERMRAY